jgi:tryptophanyl-tRNA synthetase
MVIDWLAAGVDPNRATLFIQSQVPEHAELHLLLSMMTPLGWLERVPTYKDQQEKLENKDLSTYGFLGYPLLQSADILIYRADKVPVGEDQVPHIEFSREIARRFNHLYGREPGFEEKAKEAVRKLGSRSGRAVTRNLRTRFQQQGEQAAIGWAHALLDEVPGLSHVDRERLCGYLEGTGKMILVEPGALLTEPQRCRVSMARRCRSPTATRSRCARTPLSVTHKVRRMPTDPARVRRTDPGDPDKCPVWQLHQVYSDETCQDWVQEGCRSAGIGCLDCKQPVIDGILREQAPMRERAQPLSRRSETGARDHCRGQQQGASPRARNDARRARGHGAGLPLSAAIVPHCR